MFRTITKVFDSPGRLSLTTLGATVLLLVLKIACTRTILDPFNPVYMLPMVSILLVATIYHFVKRKWLTGVLDVALILALVIPVVILTNIAASIQDTRVPLKWSSTKATIPDGLGTITFQSANGALRCKCSAPVWRVLVDTNGKTSILKLGMVLQPHAELKAFLISRGSLKVLRLHYKKKDVYFDLTRQCTVDDSPGKGELIGTFYRNKFIPKYDERPKICGGLYAPGPIAADRSGGIYVLDTFANLVVRYSQDGVFVTKWEIKHDVEYKSDNYAYLTVDDSSHLWMVDLIRNTFEEYSPTGEVLQRVDSVIRTSGEEGSDDLLGIAVDSSGFIYAKTADENVLERVSSNQVVIHVSEIRRLQKISSSGNVAWKIITDKKRNITGRNPEGISVAPNGHIFTAREGGVVSEYSSDGKLLSQWNAETYINKEMDNIADVKVDESGNVYVAVRSFERPLTIEKHDANGRFILKWRPGVEHLGQGCMAVGGNSIYIADRGNHRVLKFTGEGKLIKDWGH